MIRLHTAHDCSECVDEVLCLIIYISLKYLEETFLSKETNVSFNLLTMATSKSFFHHQKIL